MKGTTKSGFKFDVDVDALDDAELLERMADAYAGDDGFALFDVMKKMLGAEQKKKLYDHLRDDKGKVSLRKVGEEMNDIFEQLSEDEEAKN